MTLLFLAGIELFLVLILGLLLLLIPLIALIDVLRNEFTGSNKLVWVLLILLLPFFGAFLYLLIGAKQKVRRQN